MDEGFRVLLVNSNPATIMTDPGLAAATYVEPITPEVVARVIERERPAVTRTSRIGPSGKRHCCTLNEPTLDA